ncbi:ubiquinol oxidase subunit II [Stutzerimonas nosocomialis]|uniref:Ubiquinol oxidase subunit 2 n=1 Tax=Stutzerimonas nosocomialis TaxID=1056496 RepID=A0A5R9QIH7_9GAMM|nr:ubiquinol oxidase subunit II [Stutzerimonas nosocomialis]TLX64898.1 ubiquinol oxidase subunit II [Stutzerimonas nosocomialis]
MSNKRYPRFLSVLPFLTMLLLGGCDMVLFNPKGQVGLNERNLIIAATLLMLIVVIPVFIMTAVFAWKYRASNTQANYQPNWAHSVRIEAVVWGVPALIIIALGILTWKSTHALDPYKPLESDVPPVTVQVIAMDWKWLFIYPELGVASVNELAIPDNTPINFRITSDGAMTSFFIPALGGQIYAMAGMQTQLHLIANEIGEYRGFAANYNGEGFSKMGFAARAMSPADFQAWVAQVRGDSARLASMADYEVLAKPSIEHPVQHFASVQPGLFQHVVDKYEGMNRGAPAHGKMDDMPDMTMDSH